MSDPGKILVLQTAFLGDVVLSLPLVQVLKQLFPRAEIDMMVIPRAAEALRNHPGIARIVEYDKRKSESGLRGMRLKIQQLRERKYDLAIVPHRSLRSALIAYFARIPLRIGFETSAGRVFFSRTVQYQKNHHEYRRNLDLLAGIGKQWDGIEYPRLYPSQSDQCRVEKLLSDWNKEGLSLIAIAPGSVWNTKRYLPERFAELAKMLAGRNYRIALIGGAEDKALCEDIRSTIGSDKIQSFSGKLSILESAELIRRCVLLISNDSAPVHMAIGVGTPVAAIFGATVPAFGFAPYGKRDCVIEIQNLSCRPCSIHGGDKCPITTFDCMRRIEPDMVMRKVSEMLV
jgi:heptosyltransferase II